MSILISPILTEKATKLSEVRGQYTFRVERRANKVQIRKEVEKLYNVKVSSVNTIVAIGKTKTRNTIKGLVTSRSTTKKKAIVTLKEGEVIDFFNNI